MNTRKLVCQLLSTTTRTIVPRTRVAYKLTPVATRKFSSSFVWTNRLAEQKECWHCQSTNKPSALFCENKVCNVIQPIPSELDFFDLLQAGTGEQKNAPTFDVDLKALKRKFLLLQQKAHPDSYSQASPQAYKYAQLQSSMINKAYNTLKNPLSRSKYLLKEKGVQVNESDSLEDPELLMEVMEFREELEEVTSEQELSALKQRNDDQFNETVDKLKEAFNKQDYENAKKLTIELQYWNSIRNAILEWHP